MSRWAETNVIQLLNGKPSSATKRVTWIVEACLQVIQLQDSMKLAYASHSVVPGPHREALGADIERILTEMAARLSKYKCLPIVLMSLDRYFDVQYMFPAACEGASAECVAIAWLMDYIHAVHRIRRCHRQVCRKWFFAVTEHQKYCGDTCRKRDAAQGDLFKEKRRIYMKKYRDEEAERDARQSDQQRGKANEHLQTWQRLLVSLPARRAARPAEHKTRESPRRPADRSGLPHGACQGRSGHHGAEEGSRLQGGDEVVSCLVRAAARGAPGHAPALSR